MKTIEKDRKVNEKEMIVYVCIKNLIEKNKFTIGRLVKETGYTQANIFKAISKLKQLGWLIKEDQLDEKGNICKVDYIPVPFHPTEDETGYLIGDI